MIQELKQQADDLFEAIQELEKTIQVQENALATWHENDVMLLSEKTYREHMYRDMISLDCLKVAYKTVLTEIIKEL
jgi:hypothetical protein